MIKQTAEIFELLSKGGFISSDSTDPHIRQLYNQIDGNLTELYEHYASINFFLESGNEYYYFARRETRAELERKLEIAMRWIDVLDFVKTYDNSFAPGFRFQPSDILVRLKLDAELKEKLGGLKKYTGKEKQDEILEKVLNDLKRDGFIELENEITSTYKVVAAFNYLEELVTCINIPEDTQNEIPE